MKYKIFHFFNPRTHKLTRIPTLLQRSWLDSPKWGQRDDAIFVADDAISSHLTKYLGSVIQDLPSFRLLLKIEVKNNVKQARMLDEVYNFVNFCNLMKKPEKKYRTTLQEFIFGQINTKFVVHIIPTSKMMNTQLTC